MFDWLMRRFRPWTDHGAQAEFFAKIDALNAQGQGGEPLLVRRVLGRLAVPSGVLVLGDPQYVPGFSSVELEGVGAEVVIAAALKQYPSGSETVMALDLDFDLPDSGPESRRLLGEVGIDTAKLLVADKVDLKDHRAEVGPDRIGVIPLPGRGKIARRLMKRFGIKLVLVGTYDIQVVGPVSEALEGEIMAYLETIPECSKYPFMYFSVRTNNTFDRANRMDAAWDFLPIGNTPEPLMFVCGTGRGDGRYEVWGRFRGDRPGGLSIDFGVEDNSEDGG